MIKDRQPFVVLSVAALVSAIIWICALAKPSRQPVITSRVFEKKNGWGYEILVDDTLFIHQEEVPGLTGKRGFPKKQQAEKMSRLIINKMNRGQFPAVTTFELEQIYPANERANSGYGSPE